MLTDSKPTQELPEKKPGRAFRIYLVVSSTAILIAAIYVGLTFYSRRAENLEIQQRAAAQQRESDQRAIEMMGGTAFDILNFYASPGHISRGESVNLCYGVSNAKAVSLDPKDANVYPALNNCMVVTPRKTTTYTLSAEDAQGNKKTASLTATVK
jgi:hypothetical protein